MKSTKTFFIASLGFFAGLFFSCNQSGTTTEQTATNDSTTVQTPPPAEHKTTAMVVSHHVKDYATWRPFFDKDEMNRQAAGLRVLGVYQDEADPNYVSISMAVNNVEAAKQFGASAELKKVMAEAGVTDQPEVKFYTFDFMDERALTTATNYLFVVVKLPDYDAFTKAFADHDSLRKARGITAVVVARNMDDPSEVAVSLSAADMAALKNHFESPEVKETMQKLAPLGPPFVQYAKKAAAVS